MRFVRRALISVVIALLAVSCCRSTRTQIVSTLDDVETYINDRPDSALAMIQSIDSTKLGNRALRARYSLLKVMALDKNYKDILAPGLLDHAIKWYEHHGSADEKLKALFYQGRIAHDSKNVNDAAILYSRAEDWAAKASDRHAVGILYLAEANLYNIVHNIEKQKDYIEKGISVFREADDEMQEAAMGQLAIAYFSMKDWERADSLFKIGITSKSTSPYAQSVFLSNYARMKVVQPNPEPKVAIELLNRKTSTLNQSMTLKDAGAYAYALTLLGKNDQAEKILDQLRNSAKSSPLSVEIWLSRCALASGDYKQAYESLARAHQAEESEVQITLTDSISESLSAYQSKSIKQKQKRFKTHLAIMILAIIIFFLLTLLVFQRKKQIEDEKGRLLDLYNCLERESAEQIHLTTELQQKLEYFRNSMQKERLLRLRQAGKMRCSIWRLEHIGLPDWCINNYPIQTIKEELSYIYELNDSAKVLVRRMDTYFDGIISLLITKLEFQDKPEEQLFLCYCLLDLPADVLSAKFGISPNNVRVKKSRLKSRIAQFNDADYNVLFGIQK